MLFAIGAGDQVVAVDDQSDFPRGGRRCMTALSGFEPNVEAIAGYEPDLVVTVQRRRSRRPARRRSASRTGSGQAAATFDDVYTQIEQLGAITGHVGEAAELVGQMQTDIAAVIDDLPELPSR